MKKSFLLLALAGIIGIASVKAQGNFPRRTVEERVKAVMDKLADFKLDKANQDSAQAIFTDYYKAQDKMREEMMGGGGQPDREQMREKFQKMMADRDERLKKIFTEDQFKKWKNEIEPSLRPQRGGNRGGGNN
jgi:hypothetical protein